MARRAIYICTIGYIEKAIEADRRVRKGEHQHSCALCSKWYWPEHREEHEGHAPEPSFYEQPSPRIGAPAGAGGAGE